MKGALFLLLLITLVVSTRHHQASRGLPRLGRRLVFQKPPAKREATDQIDNSKQGPWFEKPVAVPPKVKPPLIHIDSFLRPIDDLKPVKPVLLTPFKPLINKPAHEATDPDVDPLFKPLKPVLLTIEEPPVDTAKPGTGTEMLWHRVATKPVLIQKIKSHHHHHSRIINEYSLCFHLDQIQAQSDYIARVFLKWKTAEVQKFSITFEKHHSWETLDSSVATSNKIRDLFVVLHNEKGEERHKFKTQYLSQGRIYMKLLTTGELTTAFFELGAKSFKSIPQSQQAACPHVTPYVGGSHITTHSNNNGFFGLLHSYMYIGAVSAVGLVILVTLVVCVVRKLKRRRARRAAASTAAIPTTVFPGAAPVAPQADVVDQEADPELYAAIQASLADQAASNPAPQNPVYVPVYYPQNAAPGVPMMAPPAYAPLPMYPDLN